VGEWESGRVGEWESETREKKREKAREREIQVKSRVKSSRVKSSQVKSSQKSSFHFVWYMCVTVASCVEKTILILWTSSAEYIVWERELISE
jgi:hypothetical protein